jgi:cell division initiation protein
MRITPIDIAHKSFQRKMMGLDPDQVTDFLRFVADEMEALVRERNALKESLREKELSVSEYRERDELLKNTITTATRMSEKMQADAERESKLILQDANQKAEMIVRDARDSLKRIYQDIADLKRIRLQFENNMKALVQSHLAMMEQGQKIMPNPSLDPRLGIEETHVSQSASSHQKELEKRISDAVASKVKSAEY